MNKLKLVWKRFKKLIGIKDSDVFDKSKLTYTDGDNT
jgi:hypothetical protein|tara:strand:- start:2757 stop:2867 length:111 start_codon:yes stop_codon:yes gene_type:complete